MDATARPLARSRRRGRLLRTLLVFILIAAALVTDGLLQPAPPAEAAAIEPIPTTGAMVWVSQDRPTRLRAAVQSESGMTFGPPLGAGFHELGYNALGYRKADRYLYGMVENTNQLIKIANNGDVTVAPTPVSGLPERTLPPVYTKPGFNQGTFGGPSANGIDYTDTYFIREGTENTRLYAVNVVANSSTLITTNVKVPNLADFVWKDGYLWGMEGGTSIFRIKPTAPGKEWVVEEFAVTALRDPAGQALTRAPYGAQWVYGNGNLGVSANGAVTGKFYQIMITGSTAVKPTFSIVSVSTGPTSDQNDGASYTGPVLDLGIEKTAVEPTVYAGGQVNYRLLITNHSAAPSTGYTVTDTLPSTLSDLSTPTPGCAINGRTLTCTGAELAPGQIRGVKIAGRVVAGTTGCIDNLAAVIGNERDEVDANNSSKATVCVVDLPPPVTSGYTLKKTVDRPFLVAGESATYTVEVTNVGNSRFTGATFRDDLTGVLDDVDQVQFTASGVSYTAPTLSWTGNLELGQTVKISYTVRARAFATGDNLLINTIEGGICRSSADCITRTPVKAYTVTKSADVADAHAGDVVTYTLVAANVGQVAYTDAVMTDDLTDVAKDAVYGATVGTFPGSASVVGGVLTWTGPLEVGEAIRVSYTVTVKAAGAPGADLLMNNVVVASARGGQCASASASSPGSTTACAVQIPIRAFRPALTIVKMMHTLGHVGEAPSLDPDAAPRVVAGTSVTWHYVVTNTGDVTITGIAVTDDQGVSVTCPSAQLAPNAAMTCGGTDPSILGWGMFTNLPSP